VLDDPYPVYDELRRFAPVYQVPGTSFYLVSSWDAVQEAVSRTADFSSNLTAALVQLGDGPSVFDMDPTGDARHVLATADEPWHSDERKLVLPTLVAKRMRALEPAISSMMKSLWEAAVCGTRIEWMSAIGDRLPMTIVARLIGLPGPDVAQLVEWGYASTELLGGVLPAERLPFVVDAAVELAGYLRAQFHSARSDPGDDLLGDLARAVQAGVVDDDVATLMLVQLIGAGGESTAGLIGNAVRLLGENERLHAAVRDDRTLVPALLEETLRMESPFHTHHRHVTADTVLAGIDLPAGSHLLLMWGAANRDPATFDAPDQVRLDRPGARGHLAFGKGLHFCVGAALARLEARIAIETLLDSTRWFTVVDAQWLPSMMVRRHRRLELQLS
jgi:cytochrome P450